MVFSDQWEKTYKHQKQLSVWPWSDLVALYFRYPKKMCGAPMDVLEIGFGAGANIPFFLSTGDRYFGIEGSQSIVEAVKTRFPEISSSLMCVDFSKTFGFDKQFDLIFDRASITHNHSNSINSCVKLIADRLKPGGIFIGVHWFSDQGSYVHLGIADGEKTTRRGFADGPYKDIDPVHFFSQEEIVGLFANEFELLFLEHISRKILTEEAPKDYTMWNVVVKKK